MSYLAVAKEIKTGSCQLDLCLIPLEQHSPFVQTAICNSMYQNIQNNYPDLTEGWDRVEEIGREGRTDEIQQNGPKIGEERYPFDQYER